jgi:hypothetical protein
MGSRRSTFVRVMAVTFVAVAVAWFAIYLPVFTAMELLPVWSWPVSGFPR